MRKGLSSVIVLSLLIIVAGCISIYNSGGKKDSLANTQ
ncbi:MAG: hypothetical protein UU90_C0029G0008, partial [candidate division WWE3 bacterium GW2011_GWD2_42_11]